MNSGEFNSRAINASNSNSVVRTSVFGYVYGNARAEARVHRKSPQVHVLQASLALKAYALMRSPVSGLAQVTSVVTVRSLVRSLVDATLRVQSVVISNRVRMRLRTMTAAVGAVTARVLRRNTGTRTASINQEVTITRMARSLVDAKLRADAVATGYVLVRTFFSTVLNAVLQAKGEVAGLILRRSVVDSKPAASLDLKARALRRVVLDAQVKAVGYVGISTYIQYEFDEPATEENTFFLAFEENIFYVR
jgi:hypothetical protein